MSGVSVGLAFVKVAPDTTGFQALLTAEVNAQIIAAQKSIKPIVIPVITAGGTAGITAEVGAANAAFRKLTTAAVEASQVQVTAAGKVAAANAVVAKSVAAVTATYYSQAEAAAVLSARTAAAGQAAAVGAGSNILNALGPPPPKPKPVVPNNTARNASIVQGSLIGATRVSGISALGLTPISAAAVAVGLTLRAAIKSAAQFESQMLTLQAVTQSTDAQMKDISATALALGADLSLPSTSATDAATALLELSKAGLSVSDSMAAAKGVLQLATAASIDAGAAAQITATQLNAFKLSGDQAVRVAELLADASIAAQGEITDFAAGFAQAGAVAAQAGVSFEDTTALLTMLGRAGLKGADGGTSLRTTLLRLVPTTKEAAQYVEALGISFDKNKTIGEQLPNVIEQYRTQLEKLNPQQRTLVLNQIFGQDAFRAASIIFSQEAGALGNLTDQFKKTNAIQDLSAAKAAGLSGAFGSLKSQIETFGTQIGLLAAGPLEDLVRSISNTTTQTGELFTALSNINTGIPPEITKKINVIFTGSPGPFPSIATVLALIAAPMALPLYLSKRAIPLITKGIKLLPEDVKPPPYPIGREDINAKASAERAKQAAAAAVRNTPDALAVQAATDAVKAQNKRNAAAIKGIKIPLPLQQGLIDAQIAKSLTAERDADNKIIAFFEGKLSRLKTGTEAYVVVSGQLQQAQSQRNSVVDQINSDAKAAADDAKRSADDAIKTQEAAAAAQELLRQTILNIQEQRFQNKIAAAGDTPGLADDRRAINNELNYLKKQKKFQQNIIDTTKKTKENNQLIADAREEIGKLDKSIQQYTRDLKNLGKDSGSGSFTLADLYKSAVDQFMTFGSNIAGRNGILSPQDARASLGKSILQSQGSSISGRQLTEAQTANNYLAQIAANTQPYGSKSNRNGLPTGTKDNSYMLSPAYGAAVNAANNNYQGN